MTQFAMRMRGLLADMARLTRMMSDESDLLGDLRRRLIDAGVRVTHGGHAAFAEQGWAFTGPDAFAPEDVLIRVTGERLTIDPEGELAWFALHMPVATRTDVVLGGNLDLGERGWATAVIRASWPDGRFEDGRRVFLGKAGQVEVDAFVPHPDATAGVAGDSATSHLFIVIDNFTGLGITNLRLATVSDD